MSYYRKKVDLKTTWYQNFMEIFEPPIQTNKKQADSLGLNTSRMTNSIHFLPRQRNWHFVCLFVCFSPTVKQQMVTQMVFRSHLNTLQTINVFSLLFQKIKSCCCALYSFKSMYSSYIHMYFIHIYHIYIHVCVCVCISRQIGKVGYFANTMQIFKGKFKFTQSLWPWTHNPGPGNRSSYQIVLSFWHCLLYLLQILKTPSLSHSSPTVQSSVLLVPGRTSTTRAELWEVESLHFLLNNT